MAVIAETYLVQGKTIITESLKPMFVYARCDIFRYHLDELEAPKV